GQHGRSWSTGRSSLTLRPTMPSGVGVGTTLIWFFMFVAAPHVAERRPRVVERAREWFGWQSRTLHAVRRHRDSEGRSSARRISVLGAGRRCRPGRWRREAAGRKLCHHRDHGGHGDARAPGGGSFWFPPFPACGDTRADRAVAIVERSREVGVGVVGVGDGGGGSLGVRKNAKHPPAGIASLVCLATAPQ